MYDRPTAQELIEAAQQHLEAHILPLLREDRKRYFQTLVAINVLKIVNRELDLQPQHARAEWTRLNHVLHDEPLPEDQQTLLAALTTRNAQLCDAIRAGEHDHNSALFAHLKATTREQLEVANPKFLAMLDAEDQA